MTDFDYHPVCLAFAEYDADTYRQRVEDYAAHPERAADTKVVLAVDDADGEWKIADGRHHERICKQLGYPVGYERFEGTRGELAALVKARNANRRHQTPSQVAASVVALNTWERGGDRKSEGIKTARAVLIGPTQADVAKAAGVSEDTIQRAAKVAKQAPEVLPAVRDGKLDAYTAAKVADLPKAERAKIVAADNPKRAAREALAPPKADDIGETGDLFDTDPDDSPEPVTQEEVTAYDEGAGEHPEPAPRPFQGSYPAPRKGQAPPPKREYPDPLGSILDGMTALSAELTRFVNSGLPEAEKFREYVGVTKVGWINYGRSKIKNGAKVNPNWRAFQAVRALLRVAYRDRNLKKLKTRDQLRQQMGEEADDTLTVEEETHVPE